MKTTIVPLVLFAALLAGCAHHGYVDPRTGQKVKDPGKTNYSDFKMAVDNLVQSLQDDDSFQECYDEFRESPSFLATGHERPVLMVGNIVNHSGDRVTQLLDSSRTRLRTRLRRTKLFKIVDDASSAESVSPAIERALVQNAEAGLKKGAPLQYFGQQTDSDYYLLGVYRQDDSEGRYLYLLELQLWNLATGEMEWSDTSEIDKE